MFASRRIMNTLQTLKTITTQIMVEQIFYRRAAACISNRHSTWYWCIENNRRSLYEAAGTSQYWELMSTGKGLRAVAQWVMSEGLLSQFSLAKEQIDCAEDRAREDDDDDDDGAEVGVSRIFRPREKEAKSLTRPVRSTQLPQMRDVESTESKTQE